MCSLLLVDDLASSSDETSSAGGNETGLLTSWGISADRGWVTNVLMVTTTMRMLDWVHGDTSDTWPFQLLGVGLEVGVVGLQEWLVSSLATGADTDHTSASGWDGLSDSGWESDTGLLAVFGVTNDDGRSTRSASETATVTSLCIKIGDNGSLWHRGDWHDISDGQGCY